MEGPDMTRAIADTKMQSPATITIYHYLEIQENVEALLDTLYVLIRNLGVIQDNSVEIQNMARELLGEVVTEALRHSDRYDPSLSKPRTWLNRIAANIVKRKRAERKKLLVREPSFSYLQHKQGVSDDDAFFDQFTNVATAGPEQDMEAMEQFEAWLSLTSEDNQRLLRLYILHDFDAARLAQVLGIKPEAARKRISRALKQLRAILEEQRGEPNG